ncbi:MAG: hypothetical protein H7Y09_03570 [Chitinophagaceae bacterium]|nr:hypothetical protein [Anaerolineae bacterium]
MDHKSWGSHSQHFHRGGWHAGRNHHHMGWIGPVLMLFFVFFLLKTWFVWPLLIFAFIAISKSRSWSQYTHNDDQNGEKEKRKNDIRFIDHLEDKPKRDQKRYVRTEDGEYLEIV